MQIKDRVVLVTGSSHRVGEKIITAFARRGAKTVVHYHTQAPEAEATVRKIHGMGADAFAVQGDISRRKDWERMRDEILRQWGKIDILVNNAAIFYRTPFFEIRDEDWDNFMNVNLKGAFLGSQIIGGHMMENKAGKIVNIADVSAETVWPRYIPYCISKAGIVSLTRGLAKALAPHVTVNAVSPGTILLAEDYDEAEEKQLIEKTPLKRIGDPEDIASAVLFLVEGSDFITGEIIKVDGGRSLT